MYHGIGRNNPRGSIKYVECGNDARPYKCRNDSLEEFVAKSLVYLVNHAGGVFSFCGCVGDRRRDGSSEAENGSGSGSTHGYEMLFKSSRYERQVRRKY